MYCVTSNNNHKDSVNFTEIQILELNNLFLNLSQLYNRIKLKDMKGVKMALVGLCLAGAFACAPTDKKVDMGSENDKNQVIETIMARRSIRKYKPQPVNRDTMKMILECGINAPNGQNKQSWEVRVVDSPELMAQAVKAMVTANPEVDAQYLEGCFRGAPTMVFIANDPSYDFSPVDCGLLAENMMLSAWSLGVGSIALGSPVRFLENKPESAEFMQKLGFSEGYKLILCVGFGYADEAPAAKPRDFGKVKFID